MIDFEYWKDLYENNPDNFNEARDNYINKEIGKKYPEGSDSYNKMVDIISAFNKELELIDDPEDKMIVMGKVLQQHLQQLSVGMKKLEEATKTNDIQT